MKGLAIFLLAALVLQAGLLLSGDHADPTRLEQVRERGQLTVLTRNGASSYYLGAEGATGPEYDLALAFADYLGVDLKIRVAESFSDLGTRLAAGHGDLVAANLSRTPEREAHYRFGPDYDQSSTEVVVHRRHRSVTDLDDLVGLRVAVLAGSLYEAILAEAAVDGLEWEARDNIGVEDLMLAIDHGDLDATLIDSGILAHNLPYYPDARRAFSLEDTRPQAWAFVRDDDDSLAQAAEAFMRLAREEGVLERIQERHTVADKSLDQFSMRHFMRQVRERLPAYLDTFQGVADAHNMDWRLLAAMGFQESHWVADAASPTGVRGLMMLTRNTASAMGLDNRLDPQQSILGGARYLQRLEGKIPERIAEPDRTWMALAAYNIGYGHLEDARVLTQRRGGNPDRWEDVAEVLPLLTQESWFATTRYGYARGHEAQQYVHNIQRYYDLLTWLDTRDHPLMAQANTTLAP